MCAGRNGWRGALLAALFFSLTGAHDVRAADPIDSTDDVREYAKGCYDALGLDAAQKAKLEPAAGFDCTTGTLLPTQWTVGGKTHMLDASQKHPKFDKWPDGSARAETAFPPQCDFPAWLSDECYGHTYVQRLDKTLGLAHPRVAAVLLCRHKGVWSADPKKFDDVAIIMHNFENGNTCWFQAEEDDTDGTKVVPPTKDDPNGPSPFWLTPQETADVYCIGCHDNGPFMHSIWITQAKKDGSRVVPRDTRGKYLNPGAVFNGWPQAGFVTVAGKGAMPKGGNTTCTTCHPISKTLFVGMTADPNSTEGNGEERGTWGRWIDWVTGGGKYRMAMASHSSKTSAYGREWERSGWMPSTPYPPAHKWAKAAKEKEWEGIYKDHIKDLRDCQKSGGAGDNCMGAADPSTLAAAGATQATAVASILLTPQQITSVATPANAFVYSFLFAPRGVTVSFEWNASGVSNCATELTFPPGVSFGSFETGSNFGGESGAPPDFGPLEVPGEYVLEHNCDGALPTSGPYEDVLAISAQVVVQVTRDAFQCYEVHGATLPTTSVTLEDRFGTSLASVRKPKRLCAPAVMTDDPTDDPNAPTHPDHLAGYVIKQVEPRYPRQRAMTVVNRFGAITVDLVRPEMLLVPTAKDLTAPTHPPANPDEEHYKCYRVLQARQRIENLEITDQLGTLTIDLKTPLRVCAPVSKNDETVGDPAGHLLCYKARYAQGSTKFRGLDDPVYVANQLETTAWDLRHLREFCVPSVLVN